MRIVQVGDYGGDRELASAEAEDVVVKLLILSKLHHVGDNLLSPLAFVLAANVDYMLARIRKRGFLITRRFESKSSSSSPKRSGGCWSR